MNKKVTFARVPNVETANQMLSDPQSGVTNNTIIFIEEENRFICNSVTYNCIEVFDIKTDLQSGDGIISEEVFNKLKRCLEYKIPVFIYGGSYVSPADIADRTDHIIINRINPAFDEQSNVIIHGSVLKIVKSNRTITDSITKGYLSSNPILVMTQSEYDGLITKDPNTIYVIKG